MRCYDCGGQYIAYAGLIELENRSIGRFKIYSPKYYKCENCEKLLFPEETLKIVDKKKKDILNRMLGQMPVDDFISVQEAAEILGISRQAFHKHRRIKNGFIYSVEKSGKKLFLKKSVERFKEKKDGRFDLSTMKINENTAKTPDYQVVGDSKRSPGELYQHEINTDFANFLLIRETRPTQQIYH